MPVTSEAETTMKQIDFSTSRTRLGRRLAAIVSVLAVVLLGTAVPAQAAPRLGTVAVGAQAGTLTAGTPGSVTYEVTVTRGSNNNRYLRANLSIAGLPAGASATFSPNPLIWKGTLDSLASPRTSTVTITTTAATPDGATPFTVTATRDVTGTTDIVSGDGTLTVGTATAAPQTITFDPLAPKTFGDADFNVSASASSGLTVEFTAGVTDQCTVAGTLVHLTGAGSCTITASQPGNAAWEPALDVPQTFTIAQATPTITFDPAPTPRVGDASFIVHATSNSDGALTYSYVSGPCALDDANAGTFIPDAIVTGECVVQADTAAGANYVAGSAQQTVNIVGSLDPIAPTLTFDPAPVAEYPGADFTVSAITNSDGTPVTYSYVSGPCALVDANAGTFTPSGSGECVVQADTAATTNFLAASAQQTVTIIPPALHLYAIDGGSTTLAGQAVTVWGYDYASGATLTKPGGPTLEINQNETVNIVLHNELTETTSLTVRGQTMPTDLTGVAPGGAKAYSLNPQEAGTFIYEAGSFAGGPHQVAMGLYGVLIVHPASPAADHDAVVLMSEIDPALNNSATPSAFDMRNYAPKYELVNGQVYPATDVLATAAPGDNVRLRYANVGTNYHSMGVLGANQRIVADDGHELNQPYTVVAQTVGPGQTFDAIVKVSANAVADTKLAVYGAGLQLNNASRKPATASATVSYGGALAFIDIAGTPTPAGPLTSSLVADRTEVSAVVSDVLTGNQSVAAAEYFVDSVDPGTGTAMNGAFLTPTEAVTATFGATLSDSMHTVYVRGQDSSGNWGPFTSVIIPALVGNDLTGPVTSGLTVTPAPTNGSVDVALHATGNDTTTGGSNVTAAEYFTDAAGADGTGTAMIINVIAPVASLDATISAATIAGLSEGPHTFFVHSKDAAGNWGALEQVSLVVDATGPVTSDVIVGPNPNNGTLAVNSGTFTGEDGTVPISFENVRMFATFTDATSNLTKAEGFLDAVGADGTGFVFKAVDGVFDEPVERAYTDIPLATVILLSEGDHTLYAHALDAAGNWGATDSTILVIDKTAPTVTGISAPMPAAPTADPLFFSTSGNSNPPATVTFEVTFSEPVTGLTTANFIDVQTGGFGANDVLVTGSGDTWTVTAVTGTGGSLAMSLSSTTGITDIAGNAMSAAGVPFTGDPGPVSAGFTGGADDEDIYSWDGTTFTRVINASGGNVQSAFDGPNDLASLGLGGGDVDGFDRVDDTHFYLSFDNNVTVPGLGTVADEDVVYYNGSTWVRTFDGSAFGIAGTDLDAITVVGANPDGTGGTLYFSTTDSDVMPGTAGPGDDADIYSFSGGTFTKLIDASAVGWSTSNVDGMTWVSATDLYLSYNVDVTVPGPLGIQDEDVVHYDGSTWSVYFDGTAHGLGSTPNLNVDAFDIP